MSLISKDISQKNLRKLFTVGLKKETIQKKRCLEVLEPIKLFATFRTGEDETEKRIKMLILQKSNIQNAMTIFNI